MHIFKSYTLIALLILGFIFCNTSIDSFAATKEQKKSEQQKALTGDAWAFGQSLERNSAIWHKGINGKDVKARAIPKNTNIPQHAADTTKGIDNAINQTKNKSFPGGVSLETQKSYWKVAPEEKFMRADEEISREGKHVVRAFADVAPSENLDINIGPELILKDETSRDHIANSTQPDTVLGLGMNFKLDF